MSSMAVVREPGRVGALENLQVRREDIKFHNVEPGRVLIEVTVRNLGDRRSGRTLAHIQAAPFGAFVPWRPLSTLVVPEIDAGESTVLQTEAARPMPRPLGPPDRVPPRRLLTAIGAEDDKSLRGGSSRSRPSRGRPQARLLLRPWTASPGAKPIDTNPDLPVDLHDLLGRHNPHLAGNLNVFVGHNAVERHLAQALRIYPGRTNVAMFVVGSGGRDAYKFHICGYGRGWDVALFDATDFKSVVLAVNDGSIVKPGSWLEAKEKRMMILTLCPPNLCLRENVDVHVRQRSTGHEAVVEFGFDPAAAGPGCYVVS